MPFLEEGAFSEVESWCLPRLISYVVPRPQLHIQTFSECRHPFPPMRFGFFLFFNHHPFLSLRLEQSTQGIDRVQHTNYTNASPLDSIGAMQWSSVTCRFVVVEPPLAQGYAEPHARLAIHC
jgi:hypothetical protein